MERPSYIHVNDMYNTIAYYQILAVATNVHKEQLIGGQQVDKLCRLVNVTPTLYTVLFVASNLPTKITRQLSTTTMCTMSI